MHIRKRTSTKIAAAKILLLSSAVFFTGCDSNNTQTLTDVPHLTVTMPFASNKECPQGGVKSRSVPDLNADGMISKDESDGIEWTYRCKG